MREGRPRLLGPVGPFQNNDPLAGHAPGLGQGRSGIIGLMQHMSEKDDIKASIIEGQVLHDGFEEAGIRDEMPRADQEITVGVDPRRPQRCPYKCFREYPCPRPDIEHARRRQTFRGQLDHASRLQERKTLRGAKPLRTPMKATLVSVRNVVFHWRALCNRLSPGGKPEHQIQRAEARDRGDQEDHRQNPEHDGCYR